MLICSLSVIAWGSKNAKVEIVYMFSSYEELFRIRVLIYVVWTMVTQERTRSLDQTTQKVHYYMGSVIYYTKTVMGQFCNVDLEYIVK